MKISSIIKIFLLISFLFFSFFGFKITKAGVNDNVSGWVWSDNIGWISLNNTTGGSAVDYGVNIDTLPSSPTVGLFSGYAWSEHIGWIDFAPVGPYPNSDPSLPDYSACLDLKGISGEPCNNLTGNYKAGGWARTVNTGGGWDGWILLRDETVYSDGVSYNKNKDQFEGWAWSDDFGWISFNSDTDGSSYDYGASANLNIPPTAIFSCEPGSDCGTSGCVGYTRCTFELENNSTDDDDGIASSTWFITGLSPETSRCYSPNELCSWTLQASHFAGAYTATLKVEDLAGDEDTTSPPQDFIIYQEAIADFMCSLTGEDGSWQDCEDISINEGEVIYFRDNLPVPDPRSTPSEDPGGPTVIIGRVWQYQKEGESSWTDFSPPYDPNSSNASTTLEQGRVTIRLTITDNNSFTGSRTVYNDYTIGVKAPPPEWKEVSPF